jgi:hypothetical protein
MMGTGEVLALVAAFLFALAAALQQREAMTVGGEGMSAGFFLQLIRHPLWLLGTATLIAGYIVQGAALDRGRVVVIQPLLVATIVFALPLGILLTDQVVTHRDWAAATGVMAGLAAFIVVGQPAAGVADAPNWKWVVPLAIVCALSGALVWLGHHVPPGRRAAILGTSAGMLFGISAALAKPVVEQIGSGALDDWKAYAMVGTGALGFLIQQGALATGRLAPAVAAGSLANPVVASVVGALVLEERLAGGILRKTVAVAALVFAGVCAAALAGHEQQASPGSEAPAPGGDRSARQDDRRR